MSARRYLHPAVAELAEARIAADEFERRVAAPLTEDEVRETLELVRWFTRRYPSAKERLSYARRKFEEWTRPATITPAVTVVKRGQAQ